MSLTDKLSVTGSEFPVADGALDTTLIVYVRVTSILSRRANTIYTSTRWGDLVLNRATSKAGCEVDWNVKELVSSFGIQREKFN